MRGVTFTGLDIKTYLPMLTNDLSYEFGILYSEKTKDRTIYPSRRAISNILDKIPSKNRALHICGGQAKEHLLNYTIPDLTHKVQRIQVNGTVNPYELEYICDVYSDHIIITQHNHYNTSLLDVKATNHAILVDASGGKGKLPKIWNRPFTTKDVGFAGGLNPSNIKEEFMKIKQVAKGNWWIDMESGIRDSNDWLDIKKIQQIKLILEEQEKNNGSI